jgi:hypothetical protein
VSIDKATREPVPLPEAFVTRLKEFEASGGSRSG